MSRRVMATRPGWLMILMLVPVIDIVDEDIV